MVAMNKEGSSAMKGESLTGDIVQYLNRNFKTVALCNNVFVFFNMHPLSPLLFFTDSIRMMEAYCDVIVLRHPEPGAAKVRKISLSFSVSLSSISLSLI